jgi:hypothetical protein
MNAEKNDLPAKDKSFKLSVPEWEIVALIINLVHIALSLYTLYKGHA